MKSPCSYGFPAVFPWVFQPPGSPPGRQKWRGLLSDALRQPPPARAPQAILPRRGGRRRICGRWRENHGKTGGKAWGNMEKSMKNHEKSMKHWNQKKNIKWKTVRNAGKNKELWTTMDNYRKMKKRGNPHPLHRETKVTTWDRKS